MSTEKLKKQLEVLESGADLNGGIAGKDKPHDQRDDQHGSGNAAANEQALAGLLLGAHYADTALIYECRFDVARCGGIGLCRVVPPPCRVVGWCCVGRFGIWRDAAAHLRQDSNHRTASFGDAGVVDCDDSQLPRYYSIPVYVGWLAHAVSRA
mgnify:CR=1 FL=1